MKVCVESLVKLGEKTVLLRQEKLSLAFCEEQLMDPALFLKFEACMAKTAWVARMATVSRAWREYADAVISPAVRKQSASRFLKTCRLIAAANDRELPELPPTVAYQLSENVGEGAVNFIKRSIAEKSASCFQSKEELLENELYLLGLACSDKDGEVSTYAMTTVADVRPMALLYDALRRGGGDGWKVRPGAWQCGHGLRGVHDSHPAAHRRSRGCNRRVRLLVNWMRARIRFAR